MHVMLRPGELVIVYGTSGKTFCMTVSSLCTSFQSDIANAFCNRCYAAWLGTQSAVQNQYDLNQKRGKRMRGTFFKAIATLALVTPVAAHSENYVFSFKANPGADGGGALSAVNDIDLKLSVDTALVPSISLATLNKSEYWVNNGFTLEMSHDGKTVRLNDAITSSVGPVELGVTGFVEMYSNIDDFLDIDFHPGAPLVDANALSYDAFVYGQIDVYNNQRQFQDLFKIAVTGDTSSLQSYISAVPEASSLGIWSLGLLFVLPLASGVSGERLSLWSTRQFALDEYLFFQPPLKGYLA